MPVTYQLQDSVATITLDDGKANAVDLEMVSDIHAALDRLDGDGARSVVLAGRPGRFCAGFNLAAMTGSPTAMRELVIAGGRLVGRLLLVPQPVVMACTGHALAMGGLLLLSGDHRIGAAGDFKIGLNEVAIGMAMPRWGVEVARYRIPPSQLEWHLVLGQTCSPDQAVQAGFLDRVVDADSVLAEARATATALAQLRTGAVSGTKTRLRGPVVERMLEDPETDLASIVLETGD
ncbi:MAG: crotonase/enoyl-CoA hydratase family protein [Acidobacteriota bacterium]|nr:crotonase/enoyl-CoA hydratase family protein [Acidobacteriota bacterium]